MSCVYTYIYNYIYSIFYLQFTLFHTNVLPLKFPFTESLASASCMTFVRAFNASNLDQRVRKKLTSPGDLKQTTNTGVYVSYVYTYIHIIYVRNIRVYIYIIYKNGRQLSPQCTKSVIMAIKIMFNHQDFIQYSDHQTSSIASSRIPAFQDSSGHRLQICLHLLQW